MNNPMIQWNEVEKSFHRRPVLKRVSLEVARGRTMALLGRNGAGKTTLIRILLGLLPADSGTVRLKGWDPSREALRLRSEIGYLAEDQEMYGWMTPVELCRFLAPFYPSWDAGFAEAYRQRLGIPADERIRNLSKGQTVKLGLLAALAHRPEVVILDDPAMGLDPIARKEFNRDLVEHLQSAGCTVLYSSHLLGEVEAVADEIAILDQGQILRTGATDELREQVKQILLPRTPSLSPPRPKSLLDVRQDAMQLALVVDDAGAYSRMLEDRGIEHEVVDLNLDEIFEAFVIGRPEGWPDTPAEAVSLTR